MKRTLAIIKPDAVFRGRPGRSWPTWKDAGFAVKALKMTRLTPAPGRRFYEVHRDRPFYDRLVAFMTSGPCIPMVLEAEGRRARLREVIGATDPAEADPGTVRALYAENKERNAIHASDSDENAALEIGFFFSIAEILGLSG